MCIRDRARALRTNNSERAAFEAAWMAHAITDGLTPAHHFPLEQAMAELRGGEGLETRTSILKKNLMKGENGIELIKNNWKFWGAKGMMTTHVAFEAGVASVVSYPRFKDAIPSDDEILPFLRIGKAWRNFSNFRCILSRESFAIFSLSTLIFVRFSLTGSQGFELEKPADCESFHCIGVRSKSRLSTTELAGLKLS